MTEYIPVFEPATAITLTASAAITGGQLVEVSGDGTVGPASANAADYVGVAAQDAASGARLVVWPRGMVHESTASGSITAGAQLATGAAGTVAAVAAASGTPDAAAVNAARSIVGIALTTAADEASVRWVAL
jgi:hypothetical protein